MTMLYNRLTENDKHFWFIDIGEKHKDWRLISVVLESGGAEHSGCGLYLRAFGRTVRIRLPGILKPHSKWVDTSKYEWSKGPGSGYYEISERYYGFTFSDGAFHLYYGEQTHDSVTTKSKCWFLPWRNWRFIRCSLYNKYGEHYYTDWDTKKFRNNWDVKYTIQSKIYVPFEIEDYDGERILVNTFIEEREWRFGEGMFKWLSLFRKPKIVRSLSIELDKEMGPEKGSWKGGTTGTSIVMLPNETHEEALIRFCQQEHHSKYQKFKIKFLRKVEEETSNVGVATAKKA